VCSPVLAERDSKAGWQFARRPRRIDWPGIIRALNEIGYDGALSVDWHTPAWTRVRRRDACRFVKALDFEPPKAHGQRSAGSDHCDFPHSTKPRNSRPPDGQVRPREAGFESYKRFEGKSAA